MYQRIPVSTEISTIVQELDETIAVTGTPEQPKVVVWEIQLVMVIEYTPGFRPILKVAMTQQPPSRTHLNGKVRGRPVDGVTGSCT